MSNFGGRSKKATTLYSSILATQSSLSFLLFANKYLDEEKLMQPRGRLCSNILQTWLGHECINDLLDERREPQLDGPTPEMTIQYVDGSGKQRCKGGRDLKKSQHYPRRSLDIDFQIGRKKNLTLNPRGKI